MRQRRFAIKREQFRQAKSIHGGLLKLFVALLGIKMARLKIPTKRLRMWVYKDIYGNKYPPGLDENELDRPLWAYPSLNALFTRGVKPVCRPLPANMPQFLCPCDGTIQDIGRIESGKLLTLKGIEYTLASLLPHTDHRAFEGGHFVVIFLSPIECHRVFSPQAGRLEKAIHVPGYRLLVHPPYQRAEYPVYTLNERMILHLTTDLGSCAVVMVAGWGVGNITLPLDSEFHPRAKKAATRVWSPPLSVQRGDWIGTFELGSTVVLLTPPAANVVPLVSPNEKVKYGQPILTYPG